MTINSQAKGKRAERDLANWLKVNGYPDAARAVKTGDRFTHDGGDLILDHNEFRLVIEVKNRASVLRDSEVKEFGEKLLHQVEQSRGDLGILVEKRQRVSNPGRWWAYVPARAFSVLQLGLSTLNISNASSWAPVRVPVSHIVMLLQAAGLASTNTGMVSSVSSGSRRLDTTVGMANQNGGAS